MFIDPETRSAMGAQAVALAKAVDYSSAGQCITCPWGVLSGWVVVLDCVAH